MYRVFSVETFAGAEKLNWNVSHTTRMTLMDFQLTFCFLSPAVPSYDGNIRNFWVETPVRILHRKIEDVYFEKWTCGSTNDVTCALMLLQSLILNTFILSSIADNFKSWDIPGCRIKVSSLIHFSILKWILRVNSLTVSKNTRHDNIIHTIYLFFARCPCTWNTENSECLPRKLINSRVINK